MMEDESSGEKPPPSYKNNIPNNMFENVPRFKCIEGVWYKLCDFKKELLDAKKCRDAIKKKKGKGYHVRIVKDGNCYLIYYGHEDLLRKMNFLDICLD